jgi:hypothetical protein
LQPRWMKGVSLMIIALTMVCWCIARNVFNILLSAL